MRQQITPYGRHLSPIEAVWGLPAPKPPGDRWERKFIQGLVMGKKDDYIKVRLSKAEKLWWQEKAVRAGLSLSNLIREAMKKTQTWTVQDRGLIAEHTRQIRRIGINLNQIAKWANTYGSTAEAVEIIECLKIIETKLEEISSFPSAPKESETERNVS